MDENMFDLGLDVATISADLPDPVITLSGADSYTVQDTADYPLLALSVYGKSVQDGTPTPEAPIDIVNVGNDGNVEITACGKNLIEGSQDFSGTWIYPWATSEETYQNLVVKENTGAWNGTAKKIYIQKGKNYTFSLYAKKDVAGLAYMYILPATVMAISPVATVNNTNKTVSLTTEWQRVNLVFECTESGYIAPRIEKGDTNTTMYVCGFQLEENNEMTEYEPYNSTTATITSGLPLCSIGDVRDELIYNADGTGKIIKRTHKWVITSDATHTQSGLSTSDRLCIFTIPKNNGQPAIREEPDALNVLCDKLKRSLYAYSSDTYIIGHNGDSINYAVPTSAASSVDELKTWLASNPITVLYILAESYEIELSAAEMAELQKLQSYEGTTNIYNDEQAEMLVKMLRSDYDMKYIEWLKESQTWTCPKAGKWKVICVGGGASGGLYDLTENAVKLTPTTAGGTTSFGSIVSADGAPSTKDSTAHGQALVGSAVSGYGGYTGTSFGGVPMIGGSSTLEMAAGGTGNAAVMAFANPTAAVGYGAGGGASSVNEKISPISGRAGAIESTIVDLEEGQTIMCTIGKGGQTTNATVMGSGADGVIVVQYLGY